MLPLKYSFHPSWTAVHITVSRICHAHRDPTDVALDPSAIALARERHLHQVLVYVVAFALIATYWTQHSLLYAGLQRVDRGLVVLNLSNPLKR